jgi:hypothetical protein
VKGHPVSLTRYQRDLEARGLRPNTVRTYVRTVAEFLQALGGPPSRAGEKDVRNYVVALQQQRASSSVNVAIAAIEQSRASTWRHCDGPPGGASATGTSHASSADAAERQ